jgi:hypothetical protein
MGPVQSGRRLKYYAAVDDADDDYQRQSAMILTIYDSRSHAHLLQSFSW